MMTTEKKEPERKPRKREAKNAWHVPYLEQASQHAPLAARAYTWSIYSMIPGVGLLLGPLAVFLGYLALRRSRTLEGFRCKALCVSAMLLGSLVALTQWGGLALMIRGLQGH